jgi:site-specific DNA-methyltransferase (adenine-specific)
MERIILLSSNEGDIVLDGLCGTGTTPVVAARLHRRYIAADIDERYVGITKQKISQVRALGYVPRESVGRRKRVVTKKELQEELRALAKELGRLPTEEDVKALSHYDIQIFQGTFATWGKALKAAKLEVQDESREAP